MNESYAMQQMNRPDYGLQQAAGLIHNPTMTERLEAEKKALEARLAEVNKALTAMQSKPEIAELIDIVTKVSRY